MILAGFPPTTIPSGTDFVTMEPAATMAPSPIVTPGIICACAPMYAQSLITTFPNESKSATLRLIILPPREYE